MLYSCSAQICIVSVDPVNSIAVTVTWIGTSLNGSVVDHYTVHYSSLNGSGIAHTKTVTFPASASSGVVSGLQEGQQYPVSVSVYQSLLMNKYSTVHLVNRKFSLQVYSEYNYVKRCSKKLIIHLSLSSVIVPKLMYGSAYEIIELCPFDIDPAATTQQPITTILL